MSAKDLIIQELEQLSESLLEEVWDFLRFLKGKEIQEKLETPILSESSLEKDWVLPEEDEAWRDL